MRQYKCLEENNMKIEMMFENVKHELILFLLKIYLCKVSNYDHFCFFKIKEVKMINKMQKLLH